MGALNKASYLSPGSMQCQSWLRPALLRLMLFLKSDSKTVWPSGLRRWLQAPVRKGVGSNPTAVIFRSRSVVRRETQTWNQEWRDTTAIAAVAQLAARRSHNPKVVSSILTCRILLVSDWKTHGTRLQDREPVANTMSTHRHAIKGETRVCVLGHLHSKFQLI